MADRRWFTEEESLAAMRLAQVLPGSTGVTAMSYFGYRRYGYVVGGSRCGFIGLVAAITIQFGLSSLINGQTWLIFVASFVLVWWSRRAQAGRASAPSSSLWSP